MSELAVELDFIVEEYAGSRGSYPPKPRRTKRTVFVATIEKASGLVNSLIDTSALRRLALVVVDEVRPDGSIAQSKLLFLPQPLFIRSWTSAFLLNFHRFCCAIEGGIEPFSATLVQDGLSECQSFTRLQFALI